MIERKVEKTVKNITETIEMLKQETIDIPKILETLNASLKLIQELKLLALKEELREKKKVKFWDAKEQIINVLQESTSIFNQLPTLSQWFFEWLLEEGFRTETGENFVWAMIESGYIQYYGDTPWFKENKKTDMLYMFEDMDLDYLIEYYIAEEDRENFLKWLKTKKQVKI
ncbi:MAG TPA: hypothetical protein ENO30_04730 [Thermodesulfobium narugense]|nr:hypothetical protein [Thermodesulfobium narugense]